MVECEIKFEQNPYGIYFAGQVLTGQVVLTLQKPKKVKGQLDCLINCSVLRFGLTMVRRCCFAKS